jgi:hypothetical protein
MVFALTRHHISSQDFRSQPPPSASTRSDPATKGKGNPDNEK